MQATITLIFLSLFSVVTLATGRADFTGRQSVKVLGFVPYEDTGPFEEGTYFHTDTSVSGTMLCSGKEKMPIVRIFDQSSMAQMGYYTFKSVADCLSFDLAIKMYGNSSTSTSALLTLTLDHDAKKVVSFSVAGGGLPPVEKAKIVAAIPYSDTAPGEEGTFFHTDNPDTLSGSMLCSGKDKKPLVEIFKNQAKIGYYIFDSVAQCVAADELLKKSSLDHPVYLTVDHRKGIVVSVETK